MVKGTRYQHVEHLLEEYLLPGLRVLEIGCGGAVYKDMFDHYTGIDIPSTEYDHGRSVDVFCDAQELAFSGNSFDLIFTVACFCQIPDSSRTLLECYRVLRPGGSVLIFDYNKKTTARLNRVYEEQGSNWRCHEWTPRKLHDIVAGAGFETQVIRDSHFWKDSGNLFKEYVKGLEPVRFILHEMAQMNEGWNIVVGKKPQ